MITSTEFRRSFDNGGTIATHVGHFTVDTTHIAQGNFRQDVYNLINTALQLTFSDATIAGHLDPANRSNWRFAVILQDQQQPNTSPERSFGSVAYTINIQNGQAQFTDEFVESFDTAIFERYDDHFAFNRLIIKIFDASGGNGNTAAMRMQQLVGKDGAYYPVQINSLTECFCKSLACLLMQFKERGLEKVGEYIIFCDGNHSAEYNQNTLVPKKNTIKKFFYDTWRKTYMTRIANACKDFGDADATLPTLGSSKVVIDPIKSPERIAKILSYAAYGKKLPYNDRFDLELVIYDRTFKEVARIQGNPRHYDTVKELRMFYSANHFEPLIERSKIEPYLVFTEADGTMRQVNVLDMPLPEEEDTRHPGKFRKQAINSKVMKMPRQLTQKGRAQPSMLSSYGFAEDTVSMLTGYEAPPEDEMYGADKAHKPRQFMAWDMETLVLDGVHEAYAIGITWCEDISKLALGFFYEAFGDKFPDTNADEIASGETIFSFDKAISLRRDIMHYEHAAITEELCTATFYGLERCWENFELFCSRLFGVVLYAHNGGKFDNDIWLRRILAGKSKFVVSSRNCVESNNRWLTLNIHYERVTTDENGYGIHLRDTMCWMPKSLEVCANSMNYIFKKDTPRLDPRDGLPDDTPVGKDIFLAINADNHGGFLYTITNYLQFDTLSLFEFVYQFRERLMSIYRRFENDSNASYVWRDLPLTLSQFAFSLWRTRFAPERQQMPPLLNAPAERMVRSCYFGGRVECRYLGNVGDTVYSYDVTSLYPYVGCMKLPSGSWAFYEGADVPAVGFPDADCPVIDRTWRCGFVTLLCRNTAEGLLQAPLHAVKAEDKLIFAHIPDWVELTLFVEEVKYGCSMGLYEYKEVSKLLTSQYAAPILKPYFMAMFEYKDRSAREGNKAMKEMYKLLLNSLYGVMGLRTTDREAMRVYPAGSRHVLKHLLLNQVKDMSSHNEHTLVRVVQDIDAATVSVPIAAAITSYGRMEIYKGQRVITDNGYTVFYTDTDSIKCNCPIHLLPDSERLKLQPDMHSDNPGDQLGSYKDEFMDEFKGSGFSLQEYCEFHGIEMGDKYAYPFFHPEGAMGIKGCKAYITRAQMPDLTELSCKHAKGLSKDYVSKLYFNAWASNTPYTNNDDGVDWEDGETERELADGTICVRAPRRVVFDSSKRSMMAGRGISTYTIARTFNRVYNKGQIVEHDEACDRILPFILMGVVSGGKYIKCNRRNAEGELMHDRLPLSI